MTSLSETTSLQNAQTILINKIIFLVKTFRKFSIQSIGKRAILESLYIYYQQNILEKNENQSELQENFQKIAVLHWI